MFTRSVDSTYIQLGVTVFLQKVNIINHYSLSRALPALADRNDSGILADASLELVAVVFLQATAHGRWPELL
ncbi:hypothetical protein VDGE_30150 [Verticillium dahliae]|uniref:Uncharacterized protein n=1 Tax=Verticillium dahliae TaxID=27337 RepID=A0A444RYB6_VERDA|nr:hypothetical protein VDGE_30150 [Verticillium dahliae]